MAVLGLLGAACGEDDVVDAAGVAARSETDATDAGEVGNTLEVAAVDYAFTGVPPELEAGTTLTLTNDSEQEVHEIVVLRLQDGEDRALQELLKLPRHQQEAISQFRGVTVAFPGEDATFSQGSLTLDEPGRYVLICTIPAGADPEAMRDALSNPDLNGPPDVDGGPPHFVMGMAREVLVR